MSFGRMTSSTKHAANQFEILSFLENGNGSKIYDVVQKQNNRKYTMEVVPRKNNTDDPKNTKLHKHSQLKAPSCYLTQLKYSFQTKSRKYFVLSHLHKERNLKTYFQAEKIISADVAKAIIVQIIEAIDKLHKANTVFGEIHIGDIYFDTRGHVILKRTYNLQTYWTNNECYSCHQGRCKNRNHNGELISAVDIANDLNHIGQLFVHMVTGSPHSYSRLDSLESMTSEFAYLLLRHDVNIEKIKNSSFLKHLNWVSVVNKELDIPNAIQRFIIEAKKSQRGDSFQNNAMERSKSNDSSPAEILVGVRKSRTKSEETKKMAVRRTKSYGDFAVGDCKHLKRSKSLSKSFHEQNETPYEKEAFLASKNRRTSIDVYQKRLAEISKVLDKNREIVSDIEPTNNIEQKRPPESQHSPKVEKKSEPVKFSFEKMYSENEALCTILTKYGLLENKGTRKQHKDKTPTLLLSPDNVSNSPKLLTSKRKQRKNNKDSLSRSCNNIQILLDGLSEDEEEREVEENEEEITHHCRHQKVSITKCRSEMALNTYLDINEAEDVEDDKPDTAREGDPLIDKLKGVNKSKTFYMKRSQSTSNTPRSPQNHTKRHFSDSTIKPNMSPLTTERQLSGPQALSSLLTATSSYQQKQTSCDSGLNVDPDDDRDEIGFKNRQLVERNDSGLGSSHERETIRLWRPGKPDSSFLEQENLKMRAKVTDCFDCGAEDIEEAFPNSIDHLCKQCGKSRIERKEAVVELIETEVNFGQDLQILKEEFYTPLKSNNILTTDEISKLFLNLQELVDVNAKLCASLEHSLEACLDQDDCDYITLAVGDVFLNNIEFFEAYELYCVKQNESVELLKVLTKKSDLLRVYLQVSSQENVKLRKMDLKSFLTMPVQRIMKYPLLLSRIYKHTPTKNADRKPLKQAIVKVEDQIARINHLSKNLSAPKLKKAGSFTTTLIDLDSTNTKDLTKMVANLKEWKLEETMIVAQDDFEVIETDLVNIVTWTKSSFKKASYQKVILAVNNAPEHYKEKLFERLRNDKAPYTLTEVKDAVLIFCKQKSIDKCLVHKNTIQLRKCILSQNLSIPVAFELSETDKASQAFVARNTNTCEEWRDMIRFVIDSFKLKWRQRRGGRPNIMTENLHLEH